MYYQVNFGVALDEAFTQYFINDLNNGATANRIKFTVTILNTLRSEINEEILLLRNAANDIVSVANSIENEARSD